MRQFTQALKSKLISNPPKPAPMRSSLRLAKEYQAIMKLELPNQLRQDTVKTKNPVVCDFPRINRPNLTAGGWHKPPTDVTETFESNGPKEVVSKKQLGDLEIRKLMITITKYLDSNYLNRK